MKIGIHSSPGVFKHSTLWTQEWVNFCREQEIEYEVIDLFRQDQLENITQFDIVAWYFTNYSLQEMLFARSILRAIANSGVLVFPDIETSWHFDDKVAQMFILRSAGIPIPNSWFFATQQQAINWFRSADYPVVAKLKGGSGSSNVRLLHDQREAKSYTRRMFGRGYDPSPSLPLKAVSNLRSAKSISTAWARAKRIPEFLRTRRQGKMLPRERGYIYLQEFVPNDGYDLKVIVIGDKLTGFARGVRPSDFRASGSGNILKDHSLMTPQIVNDAFAAADALGVQCIGFDYVVDQRSGQGLIIEMSYAFSFEVASSGHGHWTRNGEWHPEPLNAPRVVLKNLIEKKARDK